MKRMKSLDGCDLLGERYSRATGNSMTMVKSNLVIFISKIYKITLICNFPTQFSVAHKRGRIIIGIYFFRRPLLFPSLAKAHG